MVFACFSASYRPEIPNMAPMDAMAPKNTFPWTPELFCELSRSGEAYAQWGFRLASEDLIGGAGFLAVASTPAATSIFPEGTLCVCKKIFLYNIFI